MFVSQVMPRNSEVDAEVAQAGVEIDDSNTRVWELEACVYKLHTQHEQGELRVCVAESNKSRF